MRPAVADQSLYPLEFFVEGTPISAQGSSRSKDRWRAIVRNAATERVRDMDDPGFLDRRPVSLVIYYFSVASVEGDVDNIVKPIMDALVHVAYPDDRHVERLVIQKFEPEIDWDFAGPSDGLAAALDAQPPVVYVRVDDDLRWRRLS